MYDTSDLADERMSEAELRKLEEAYCSYGDTVHYLPDPKFFETCDGSYMYDAEGRAFLDLQMWYSAVNFGYRNPRINAVAHQQLDRLPQVASQYLHREKVELAAWVAQDLERKFGKKGRVHFNVGGAQAVEDALKLVRNASNGKSLMFAFEGGLSRPHARRLLHHLLLSLSPPLRPFRRAGAIHRVSVSFPRAKGPQQGRIRRAVRGQVRPPVRDRI